MKFNSKTVNKTVNLAGGKAYDLKDKYKLATAVLSSFVQDKYYKSELSEKKSIISLVKKEPEFASQLALYARHEAGMRSVSHFMASYLSEYFSGKEGGSQFYCDIIRRPDDITEIVSLHFYRKLKLSNAMKKGFAKRLSSLSEYQLAKYQGKGNEVKLLDVVNLVHPQTTEGLSKLMKGTLKQFNTWENELSAAGSDKEKKEKVWADLLNEDKLGYFAALRNIRNIHNQSPESEGKLISLLTNEEVVRKSLVMPFRFTTAYNIVKELDSANKLLRAVSRATELSLKNVPVFEGSTLVVLDSSGSMDGKPIEIGSLFAASLVKTNDADLITFADRAKYQSVNPDDSLQSIVNSIDFDWGGTNLASVFDTINKKYDRIIVLSDFQTWGETFWGGPSFNTCLKKYEKEYGRPIVYSWDLQGYGTTQIPQHEVFLLAGFNDKVFDVMRLLESDREALIHTIENYNIK